MEFVFNPVSGAATRQPFVGQIQFNAVDIQAAGLPDSPGTTLPAGQPVTATVAVHNTGVAPESFFADPRSTAYAVQRLIASGPETGVPLPQHGVLNYQVPTQTSLLTATASATSGWLRSRPARRRSPRWSCNRARPERSQ